MWGSRKPGGGGGSGTPGDSYLVGLARGQPGVGAHLAGAAPGVDPHCPGAGRLTFVPRFNVFLPPTLVTMRLPCSHKRECTGCSKNCEHGRQRYSCKECGGGGICEHGRRRGYCKECGVWSYESTSMEDLVGYSCGVCKVRECVCQPGGAELTRPPAGPGSTRGRASLDPRVARVRHSL